MPRFSCRLLPLNHALLADYFDLPIAHVLAAECIKLLNPITLERSLWFNRGRLEVIPTFYGIRETASGRS